MRKILYRIFSRFKNICENILKKLQSSKDNTNEIHSRYVSSDSINGANIVIMDNTHIDEKSSIGGYTYLGYNCFVTKAKIGRYCSIANNVSIGMGEHKIYNISTSSLFYRNAYEELTDKKCVIGNDVWIGVDCIIRRGVTIGNGAIIGANSVVTHDIPEFAIAVGSPARIIKYRFSQKQIQIINDSKWWENEISVAEQLLKDIERNMRD